MKPTVILRKAPDYDLPNLTSIIRESVIDLGLEPAGKVFVKPNVVTANRKYIHHSYTHPSVVEAMVSVLREAGVGEVVVGESGGYGIPSRLFLEESGYLALGKRLGVRVVDLNEHPLVRVGLDRGKWHRDLLLSRFIAEAGFKVWMPKLKYHIFAGITHALKLNIGILTHSERMLFHDHRVHEKIVDLLEVGFPDLVVSDAIDITYGYESAPYPVRLGLLLIANHPLAADVVAAHIMGHDPGQVRHLRIAHERGYGPLDLREISIRGDADLDLLRRQPKGRPRLFQVLAELDTPIRFFAGTAPDTDLPCDGGCEAAVKGCLGTIEKRSPGALKLARPGAIVHGVYRGDVVVPDGPVLLVGDCTRVEGELVARRLHRLKGCPIGTKRLLFKLPFLFGLPSPLLEPRDALLFVYHSLLKAMSILRHRLIPVFFDGFSALGIRRRRIRPE